MNHFGFAAALELPPTGPLGPYLQLLASMLEQGRALEFQRSTMAPPEFANLVGELKRLASLGFRHAVRARREVVLQWLGELNDLQRPACINFAEWTTLAQAQSGEPDERQLPVPSAALRATVSALFTRGAASLPIGDDRLGILLDQRSTALPEEVVAFFRLAGSVELELGDFVLHVPSLSVQWPGLTLVQKDAEGPISRYRYQLIPGGEFAQTTWYDAGCECSLKVPQPVAPLTAFLVLAQSPERLQGTPLRWSPGPLLPVPGQPPPRLTAELKAQNRRRQVEGARAKAGLTSLDTPDEVPASVAGAFDRIERWLAAQAPHLRNRFGSPATFDRVAWLEGVADGPLPGPVREYLARHDGLWFQGTTLSQVFLGYEFLPLLLARAEHEMMGKMPNPDVVDTRGPVKPMYWNRRWVPISLLFGASNYHCVDFDPRQGGARGQVISVGHDSMTRAVIAPDLGHYFTRFARALERDWATVTPEGLRLHDQFNFPEG